MPLPTPKKGESKRDFLSRFHSETSGEYADPRQRHAVGLKQWVGKDFARALLRGTREEMEHTDDLRVAMKIAADHLAERRDYYDRMEAAGLTEGKTMTEKDLVTRGGAMGGGEGMGEGLGGGLDHLPSETRKALARGIRRVARCALAVAKAAMPEGTIRARADGYNYKKTGGQWVRLPKKGGTMREQKRKLDEAYAKVTGGGKSPESLVNQKFVDGVYRRMGDANDPQKPSPDEVLSVARKYGLNAAGIKNTLSSYAGEGLEDQSYEDSVEAAIDDGLIPGSHFSASKKSAPKPAAMTAAEVGDLVSNISAGGSVGDTIDEIEDPKLREMFGDLSMTADDMRSMDEDDEDYGAVEDAFNDKVQEIMDHLKVQEARAKLDANPEYQPAKKAAKKPAPKAKKPAVSFDDAWSSYEKAMEDYGEDDAKDMLFQSAMDAGIELDEDAGTDTWIEQIIKAGKDPTEYFNG